MKETKERKIDRRTRYTCMVIKDALLALLAEKEYADITVADICRKAELNRGTFYLHYDNIHQVMDELFDEALGNMNSVLVQIGCESSTDSKCSYPLCCFLRENRKFQPLFFSESLHSHVIERISAFGWERFAQYFGNQSGLSEEILKAIFSFQLNGCLAVSRQNIDIPDERWAEIQCSIDRLLKAGFSNL